MRRQANPIDLVRTSMQLGLLTWEAQMVVGMRLMGMAGGWSVLPSENKRMIDEKAPAFAQAAWTAGAAVMAGQRPDQVVDAWTRSLRGKTGPNLRRLVRRGPSFG